MARAESFPIVERLETKVRTLVPTRLITRRIVIRRRKPRVIFPLSELSCPRIWRAVFTTPVAMTPQAMLAATNLVIPT